LAIIYGDGILIIFWIFRVANPLSIETLFYTWRTPALPSLSKAGRKCTKKCQHAPRMRDILPDKKHLLSISQILLST
jgi:hypothetical protein